METTLLSKVFLFRLVYLKTDRMLHSYGLPEKPYCIGKNVSIYGTGYFSNLPIFGAKGSVIYGCTDAIWSTDLPKISKQTKSKHIVGSYSVTALDKMRKL